MGSCRVFNCDLAFLTRFVALLQIPSWPGLCFTFTCRGSHNWKRARTSSSRRSSRFYSTCSRFTDRAMVDGR